MDSPARWAKRDLVGVEAAGDQEASASAGADRRGPTDLQGYLPPARGGENRRRGDAARQKPLRPRPVPDTPALATGLDGLRPWPLRPSAPVARADSPGVAGLAALWRRTGPDRATASLAGDPTRAESARAALQAKPILRLTPVPFIRRTLPNPFALAEAIALDVFPPDADPPAPPQAAPTPPRFAVAPKPSTRK